MNALRRAFIQALFDAEIASALRECLRDQSVQRHRLVAEIWVTEQSLKIRRVELDRLGGLISTAAQQCANRQLASLRDWTVELTKTAANYSGYLDVWLRLRGEQAKDAR